MDTIRAIILSGGPPYIAFALLLTACGIGFPFSSDLTLITGGVLAGTKIFSLFKAIPLAYTAILLGDTIAFFAGRKFGHKIVRSKLFRRVCSEKRFNEISKFLNENASKFIFSVRFTPGARSVIFLTAGTIGVKPKTFYRMNCLSTAIYVPSIMTLAFFAAYESEALVEKFKLYSRSITLLLVVVILSVFFYRRRK